MGKSNRIRANRATAKAQSKALGVKKKRQGMPSWLMTLITLVITVAILLTVVLSLLSANGIFGKMRTPLATENYKINNNMLSYYFYTQYQAFQTDYSSYLSYFSLDTSKSLKDQTFGGDGTTTNYDTAFLGDFSGTWFDYFMDQTVEGAKSVLLFCEEADARSITLTDEEKQEIETAIDTMTTTATTYGYTLNAYLSATYGAGVKVSDVRKAMTYSALASKCMNTVMEELDTAITDDRVESKYSENKLDFNVVDYTYYTFRVDYDDVLTETLGADVSAADMSAEQKAQVLDAYQKAVKKAKDDAELLKAKATAEEFMASILDHVSQEAWDDAYGEQTVEDADKPTDEDLTAIKTALIADVLAEIAEGKEEADEAVTIEEGATSVTVYEKTVTANFAKVVNTVKEEVFSTVSSAKETSVMDAINYAEEDDFSEWAFADGRVAGEKTVIITGDGSGEGDVTNENGYSYVSSYYLRAPQYRNTEKTRDVAYMLFGSSDEAKAAIEKLLAKESLDLAGFEAIAAESSATGNTHVENYYAGQIGSDAFDEWLFADDTTVGKVSAEPIALDESTYAVLFYYGEGDEKWHVDVQNTILSEDYDAYCNAMAEKYPIQTKENTWKKIEA
ncbi:MAG: hypothetical protein IJY47_05680 [Clostridia bacterium]|nr:hypothetical protein [Clostridia bacterium]